MPNYVLATCVRLVATLPPSLKWEVRARFPSAEECKLAWNTLDHQQREVFKCLTDDELVEVSKPLPLPEPTPFLRK